MLRVLQVIDRREFEAAYRLMLPDATPEEERRVFEWMDQQVSRAARIVSRSVPQPWLSRGCH